MSTRIHTALALVIASGAQARGAEEAAARAPALEVEVVLSPAADRSRPAQFLSGIASLGPRMAAYFPKKRPPKFSVRECRRGEAPGVFARMRIAELPLLPFAKRIVAAAGIGEVTLQAFIDGDTVRMVASVRLEPGAPAPPLANARLALPEMREGDWAAAAATVDPKRLVPWAVEVADRVDEFKGQMLKDALVVATWNLGIDVEKDIAGSFAGGVRALACEAEGGGDSVAVAADLRATAPLEKALATLALGSRLVGGAKTGLDTERFGDARGYRVRTPLDGLAPSLALHGGLLLAWTARGPVDAGPGALVRRLSASPGNAPGLLAGVGGGDVCAAGIANVLECVRAAGAVARSGGADSSRIPAPHSLAWADGDVAVALRVGGEGFQAWGVWVPSRSALAVPADDAVADR